MILKLTVLMALACLADLALRKAPAALRHLIWSLALVCALVLPVTELYAPRIAGPAFTIHTAVLPGALTLPPQFNWAFVIYGLGVALMLARLGLDVLAANRLVREARPAALPGVLVSDRAIVPFAWRSIVVPAGMEECGAVVAHERAHIARADMWTSLMARLACAVYWFHPLVWWAAARMRLEADRACDDAVLRSGFEDTGYAGALIEIAKSFMASQLAPGAVRQSQLEIRVRHILADGVNRRKLGAAAIGVAVLTALLVLGPLSALSPQLEKARVYRVGDGISPPSVLSKVDPEYSHSARLGKVHGPVLLSIVVGADGQPHDIRVVRSLEPGLDANAIAAVRKWRFRPGKKAGAAVDVKATIEVNFRLL